MRLLTILTAGILTASLNSFAGPGHSHGGHSHPHGQSHDKKVVINKLQAQTRAMDRIKVLIFKNKIDSTWSDAKLDKAIKVKKEWLITYTNEKGVKGKKLYVFLDLSGKFIAANFTGK
jgi:hypothetical protein